MGILLRTRPHGLTAGLVVYLDGRSAAFFYGRLLGREQLAKPHRK
ncbi:hypothetical protein PVE_R2G0784 [Pseudomonas veronii 1YdBTEX2]|uniref:Uncharacterized protein n=1 Tax=Pseudomonas veronii 1YdBTEX2 TaxID=1295141 RepID=A0A1D3K8W9_PSEVE|nr:hypothetical protein PVE_R2G0784 [Pseudomonas veronii 1YdBTEX2]